MNIITEYSFLLIAILTLVAMLYTKPRRTKIYHIDCAGMIASIIEIVLTLVLVKMLENTNNFDYPLFLVTYILFLIGYLVILNLTFNYILLLTPELLFPFKYIMIAELIYDIGYCVFLAHGIISGKMYVLENGGITITKYFYSFLNFGILNSIYGLLVWIIGRKNMSRIVKVGIFITSAMTTILLLMQGYHMRSVFLSATYVLPFLIFYVLFHSNPYNENAGCQNEYSFETRFLDAMYLHKEFVVIYVKMTQFRVNGKFNGVEQRKYALSKKSRQIEFVSMTVSNYIISDNEFAVFIKGGRNEKTNKYIDSIYNILASGLLCKDAMLYTDFKMTIMESNEHVNTMHKLKKFFEYTSQKFHVNYANERYDCVEKDYENFLETYSIENMLIDIRNKLNLDDERVLCYTQPIYCIKTNTFRTAEALMRLKMGDKIIYPDKFIELAERNGCIHALTCIILNKVCKEINMLNKEYDFDAITINCSTVEMEDENLDTELIEILEKNKVISSKIRLELTESTISGNYEIVSSNMKKLNQAGVKFYLDDFGTGYSNLARIVSFPFMTIKFDKSILYRALSDNTMNDLLDGMVTIFKKKGFVLLIEGVENDEHSEYSIEHGFDYIQGYKYAKPVPIEKLSEYFEKI